jgi:SAM-dependent methyltransferase
MTTDRELLMAQYRDGAKLDARVALHARFSTSRVHFHDWLFDLITAPPDAQVLEVGCGTGALWQQVHKRVPSGWRLTLTDFSHGMASGLRTKCDAWGLRARFAQCDAQALPFAGAQFDLVLANHMLYPVPDLARGIAEIARVLQPGGLLVAATNGEGHLRELIDLAAELGVPPHRMWEPSFTLENGAELLSRSFQRVERRDFEDSLAVTEAEPLVAYITSMSAATGVVAPEGVVRLREVIGERLRREGVIRIRKSTGAFLAYA